MHITPQTLVSDIAVHHPATIPALERLGIDYCCGGGLPLEAACRARAIETAPLIDELESLCRGADSGGIASWKSEPLGDLIDHIVAEYHTPLRRDLAIVDRLLEKVLARHGGRYPEMLPALGLTFTQLRNELQAHTRDEELVCFPHVRGLLAGVRSPTCDMRALLPRLTREHLKAGFLLRDLRALTNDFTAPADACPTFRALFAALEAIEGELHRHVHLETNVLFPRAAALETKIALREHGR